MIDFEACEKALHLRCEREFGGPHPPPKDAPPGPGPGGGPVPEDQIGDRDFLIGACFPNQSNVRVGIHHNPPPCIITQIPHYHDFFEIVYVTSGECLNVINRQDELTVDPRHILLMNEQTRHTICNLSSQTHTFNLLLKHDFVAQILMGLLNGDSDVFRFFLHSLYGERSSNNYLYLEINPEITGHFDAIVNEYFGENPFYEQMIMSHLVMAFGEMARLQQKSVVLKNQRLSQSGQIGDILQYIRLNYSTATLASTAVHFNYSEGYLSRMIKKHTGQSFSDIQQEVRYQIACNYLNGSCLSLEQISDLVGYQTVGGFFKGFKKKYGLSPGEFREQGSAGGIPPPGRKGRSAS